MSGRCGTCAALRAHLPPAIRKQLEHLEEEMEARRLKRKARKQERKAAKMERLAS